MTRFDAVVAFAFSSWDLDAEPTPFVRGLLAADVVLAVALVLLVSLA